MRKAFLAAALVILGAAVAFWLLRPSANFPREAAQPSVISPTISPARAIQPNAAEVIAIKPCLGAAMKEGESLEANLLNRIPSLKPQLQWRVVRAEANGQEFRLRLALEPSEAGGEKLTLKIFSVDAEGLPDLLPDSSGGDPEKKMAEFLEGKRLINTIESVAGSGANGEFLRMEKEDGELVELEFKSDAGRLACAGKAGLRCRCL